MTVKECVKDVGVSRQAIHRWIKKYEIPTKRSGLRDIYIEPEVWETFCKEHNIKRKGS